MYRIITAQCLLTALTICCCTALLAEDAGEVGKSPDESYGLAADQIPPAALSYLQELETARQQTAARDSDRVLPEYWQQLARERASVWGVSAEEAIEKTRSLYGKKAALVRNSSRGTAGSNVITVGADIGGACDYLATNGNNGLQDALDAANQGANAGVNNEIRVARSGDYSGRRYFINDSIQGDQTISIVGGYAFCTSAEPDMDQPTVLDASGTTQPTGPAIGIFENLARETVVLENLTILNGSNPGGNGGGLRIENKNFVVLRNTRVINSNAENGGGVSVSSLPDGETVLLMLDGSLIANNSADESGGGLYCSGAASSVGLDSLVSVSGNQANNGGGAYAASGCNLGSFASFPGGLFSNNAAVDGAGAYVVGMGSAFLLSGGENAFFAIGDASTPGTIDNNTAGRHGGGIFAGDASATGSNEQVDVLDGWVSFNEADADPNSFAIGSGGGIYLLGTASLSVDRSLAGEDCHSPVICSRIASNTAQRGAAIRALGGDGTSSQLIDIRQTWITGNTNTASPPIINIGSSSADSGIELLMEGNVIANNLVEDGGSIRAINLQNVDSATIAFTTITDNNVFSFDAAIAASGQGSLNVFSSILHEDFGSVFDANFSGGLVGATDCLLVHEDGTQPPQSTLIFVGDPGFDETIPYGLTLESDAIDICDTANYIPQENDILGNPRGIGIVGIPDFFGPYDLGAVERNEQADGGEIVVVTPLIEAMENVSGPPAVFPVFQLERQGGSKLSTFVRVFTVDGDAVAGVDYVPIDTVVEWGDGDNGFRDVLIEFIDNDLEDGNKTFTIVIEVLSGASVIGSPSSATVTIIDDETVIFRDGFEISLSVG